MINYRNSCLIAKEINRKSITAPSIGKVQRWITRRGFIYKSHVENGLLIDVSKKSALLFNNFAFNYLEKFLFDMYSGT